MKRIQTIFARICSAVPQAASVTAAVGGFLFLSVLFSAAVLSQGTKRSPDAVAVSADTAREQTKREPLVILDAGHGGEDGGAVSASGVMEKTLNLSVALQLSDMLEAAGIPTLCTRTEDDGLYEGAEKGRRKMTDLKNRLQVAKEHPDAVFCSIHMNTYPSEKYHGTQVFYSAHDEESKRLAECIRTAVKTDLQPENERECKPATSAIYVLDHAEGTAVLVECGFLSNPAEAERLSLPEYREKLSAVLCKALLEFLSQNLPPERKASSQK